MMYYLINCRSLTYAQQAERLLERAGITAHILRTPQSIAKSGCSHSVKVSEHRMQDAISVLRRATFPIIRVYMNLGDGTYEEVPI